MKKIKLKTNHCNDSLLLTPNTKELTTPSSGVGPLQFLNNNVAFLAGVDVTLHGPMPVNN